jgi:hypothetical protein
MLGKRRAHVLRNRGRALNIEMVSFVPVRAMRTGLVVIADNSNCADVILPKQ